uniref:DNA-directed RNA polymerase III subunit RPC6 n=1 Tax=Lygus hesperus TaxID=30085 RepID=A0A0A9YUE3_LYGHE
MILQVLYYDRVVDIVSPKQILSSENRADYVSRVRQLSHKSLQSISIPMFSNSDTSVYHLQILDLVQSLSVTDGDDARIQDTDSDAGSQSYKRLRSNSGSSIPIQNSYSTIDDDDDDCETVMEEILLYKLNTSHDTLDSNPYRYPMVTSSPCISCPFITNCGTNKLINPETCVYFSEWF